MSKSLRHIKRTALALIGIGGMMALAACGSSSSATSTSGASAGSNGSASTSSAPDLKTYVPGKLTVATSDPAYSPWVENNNPASGQGFESAVVYAMAAKLGYSSNDVVWTRTTFDAAITPGPKNWDLNIQQFSITPEREKAVDFSAPYYTTNQAIVTYKGSPAAGATSLAALKNVKFGVQVGTTSLATLTNIIKPSSQPKIYNSSDDVVHALVNKQIQAIVVDLPTALYITSSEMKDGVVVGQLSSAAGGDNYGIVLPKGSPLTVPVSGAINSLKADGTLAALQKKWLSDSIDVPVLK